MAHSLSAKKRVRQNEKHRIINRSRKSMIKTQIKHFDEAIKAGDLAKAESEFVLAQKKLDKISSTSTMHKNTAARIKSRLCKRMQGLKAKAS